MHIVNIYFSTARMFKPPPSLPKHDTKECVDWAIRKPTSKHEAWAQYFGSILWKWDLNTKKATIFTWKQLVTEVQRIRRLTKQMEIDESGDEKIEDTKDRRSKMRDRKRYWLLNSLAENLRIDKKKTQI